MGKKNSPYGSWRSPVTSDMVASRVVGLTQVEVEGEDVYWIETRPSEEGRHVIVRNSPNGESTSVNPPPFNARSRIHEYGGGAYMVNKGAIYFTNFNDQRIYRMDWGQDPQPITQGVGVRYADMAFDNRRGRFICVREDHRNGAGDVVNTLVSMDLDGGDECVMVSGNDFYSSPRISPDGRRIAWVTWNHPNMPWDITELWVAELGVDGSVEEAVRVTRGFEESVLQPVWSPGGILHFISDRSNWWNIYCWERGEVRGICPMESEFAVPHWVFAQSNYAFLSEDSVFCSYTSCGEWHIAQLDRETGELMELKSPYTHVSYLKAGRGFTVFIGRSHSEAPSIVRLYLETREIEVLKRSSEQAVDAGYISMPRPIEFPTEGGLTAHAIYYNPCNKDYAPHLERLPPLLVFAHGGPTSAADATLSWTIQYWTSRGIAVVDVNYGGSTGYGRNYRQRLKGRWGVVDVDDCVNAAKHLVNAGSVDGGRLAIRGGSAGGYTTINALTFRDLFKAGASYYGISDLEVFVKDTHKFEARYLDTLIGPYPERRDLYHQRSAINFLEKLKTPIILFQGLEDKIVPPSQAELIVDALRKMGKVVAYLPFKGEQHGFRRADSIKKSLEAELYFYSQILDFQPADDVKPIMIENLNTD